MTHGEKLYKAMDSLDLVVLNVVSATRTTSWNQQFSAQWTEYFYPPEIHANVAYRLYFYQLSHKWNDNSSNWKIFREHFDD